MSDKKLLDINEVSEITTLGVAKIKKMVKNGKFPTPAINDRNFKRWLISDIESWLSSISTVIK